MSERGTSSQVSVVFESHGWLEVEEGKNERELLLGGEKRSEEYQPESLSRGPCSPFYQTSGAGYINAMEQARREERGESVHEKHVYGGSSSLMPRVPLSLFAAIVACCCLSWCPPHMQEVGAMNASYTWHMHGKCGPKNYSGGLPTNQKCPGWCCT
jgi:hypothetical protein